MPVQHLVPAILALAVMVVGLALFIRAIVKIVNVIKLGQPTLGRADNPGSRWGGTLVKETLGGHTRMLQISWVGAAH